MPIAQILDEFRASVAQCDSLIANAHRVDAGGAPFLPLIDRQQITVAAFLNMFIAWETFLESSLSSLMIGEPTISGTMPNRFVSPRTTLAAREMVIGVLRYFDYGNHEHLRKIVGMYFENGHPFEPHIGAIFGDLADMRTMRNASAHITSTTQLALETLALRIFGQPQAGILLYQFLTTVHPNAAGETVIAVYRNKLVVTAELIAQG